MLSSFQTSLCDMQGRLFVMSGEKGYDSESFIKAFMKSDIARDIDSEFNFMQWSGKEYIMERIEDELKDRLQSGIVYDEEVLFWIGYVYRYWQFYTGENSKTILKQAPVSRMCVLYLGYHTLSVELAIEKLKERNQK